MLLKDISPSTHANITHNTPGTHTDPVAVEDQVSHTTASPKQGGVAAQHRASGLAHEHQEEAPQEVSVASVAQVPQADNSSNSLEVAVV